MSTKIVFEEDCNDKMLPFSFDLKPTCLKYVSTIDDILDMASFFDGASLVGIDTERKPSKYNKKGEGHIINPTSIIQIAVRNASHDENVYIVDLITISSCQKTLNTLDNALNLILGNDTCVKIGQGLERDFRELHTSYPDVKSFVKVNSVIETTSLIKHIDATITSMVSLKYLVQRFLNCNLVKTQQMSNWELRPLTLQQVHYAACDALVLLRLYDAMLFEAEEVHSEVSDCPFDISNLYTFVDCSVRSLSKKRSRNNLSSNSLCSGDTPDPSSSSALLQQQYKGWTSPCAREWFSEQMRSTIDSAKRLRKEAEESGDNDAAAAVQSPSSGSMGSSGEGSLLDELTLPLPVGRGAHLHFSTSGSASDSEISTSSAANGCTAVGVKVTSGRKSVLPVKVSDDDSDDSDEEETRSMMSIKSIISRSSSKSNTKKKTKTNR